MPAERFRQAGCGAVALTVVLMCVSVAAEEKPVRKTVIGVAACVDCWNDQEAAMFEDCADHCRNSGDALALFPWPADSARHYRLTGDGIDRERWLGDVGRLVQLTGSNVAGQGDFEAEFYSTVKPDEVVDTKAPRELELRDTDGVKHRLSDYRGRVVVLNFWATWCGPCRSEMPELAALQKAYDPTDVLVIGAASDGIPRLEQVLKICKERGVNYPIWLGSNGSDMAAFGFSRAIPATAVLDRDGIIVWSRVGTVRAERLKREIEPLLNRAANERPSPAAQGEVVRDGSTQ